MNQKPETLRAILRRHGGRACSLDPDHAMDLIAECLAERPELIEELAPGKRLAKKPITKKERNERMFAASLASREKQARARRERALPLIKAAMKKKPDITLRQLASVLDRAGIKPQRSERWSAASVQLMMRKANMIE